MARIFVSYSRKDTDKVKPIIDKLKIAGYEVWMDTTSIRGGKQWRTEIVKGIEGSDAIILVLSENSIRSDNVRKEMDLAEGSKKSLIPLALQPVEIPDSMEYQLAGIQWIDMYTDFEGGFQQLLETLEQPTPQKIDRSRPQPVPMLARVPSWIPILGIGLALGIILAIVGVKQFIPQQPTAQPNLISQGATSPPPVITQEPTPTPTNAITPSPTITQEPTLTPTNTITPSPTTVKCPGAVPSKIQVGIQAHICTKRDRVKTFETPIAGGKEIFRLNTGTELEVVGGPKCAGSSTWWQIKVLQGTTVHYGSDYPLPEDMIVWVQEGSDTTDPYWICPLKP